MAKSPAHKLGQIVGDEIEAAIRAPLQEIADEFDLYLDHRHPRPARANKRKVAWEDSYGNVHDLDYVLEEGGDEHTLGVPRAFIEIAWRRYTKHSRNKVQEIQGAVLPVAERHIGSAPFLGAVLAGDFTEASRDQLRSHGFHIAYLSYEMIVEAFRGVGVDVFFDEGTTAGELRAKVRSYGRLPEAALTTLRADIRDSCVGQANGLDQFFTALRDCLGRRITRIVVLALSGTSVHFHAVDDAIRYVEEYDESKRAENFDHYELNVRYSNGREVRGSFPDRKDCLDYLQLLCRA